MRSLTSARGKGVNGVLPGVMSSQGTTGNTRVRSPSSATTATGNEMLPWPGWGGGGWGGLFWGKGLEDLSQRFRPRNTCFLFMETMTS